MKVILVRHGQSESNIKKEFGGHKDAPLTALGVEQAKECSKRLKEHKFARLISSDLKRAHKTASVINECHQLEHEVDANFRELLFGKWEGLTYKEIKAEYPAGMEEWEADFFNFTPPEGESMLDLYARVTKAYDAVIADLKEDDTCLIVAHGGVIQTLLSYLLHGDEKAYWTYGIDNCGVATIDYVMGRPVLKGLNQ